jgi:hypothetical protein
MSILRADSIRDRAGTGAPNFPNGATVTGVITATSFSGAVTGNVTGNVTGTSAGLTGTPSIIVQDATVQGDLTVNGTTSTIDTVITAVDSLNVEGNVGIGTDNPGDRLEVSGGSLKLQTGVGTTRRVYALAGTGVYALNSSGGAAIAFHRDGSNNDEISFETHVQGTSHAERVRITAAGTAIFKGGLAEKFNNVGGPLDTNRNQPLTSGNVIIFTGNETGNANINITGVHSVLASGESFSITAVISPNNVCIINTFDIDGVSQTIKWSGGSAPTAGASGRDVYTFTAVKTGTGTTDYEVFGAATNYA